MTWPGLTRAALAVVVGGAITLAGYAVDAASGETAVVGPGLVAVDIDVVHSRFSVERLVVWEGTVVEFAIDNRDPIHHEFVLGSDRVHRQHRRGTERFHPPVPGEVSLPPNFEGSTFYRFDEPGTYEFVCHLPGHEEYGMIGEVEVRS